MGQARANGTTVGSNVEASMDGTRLVLVIDTAKEIGPSKSGLSTLVGTTRGAVDVAGLKLTLSAYRKR